tara:strand:+ start:1212 stop:1457 length:246 start_codon:yes stop_codon:yes gene_type:complete
MNNSEKANQVLEEIKSKVEKNEFFSGIEITSINKKEVGTEDVCVRVLVNKKDVTHADMGIPKEKDGIPIEIVNRTIEAQSQ